MKKISEPFASPEVESVFQSFDKNMHEKLLSLRQLIFDVASETDGVGKLEETLKWGQPSYLTTETKSGTTIRLDQLRSVKDGYGMFFHCHTSLIASFRELFGGIFRYDGNRAILFNANKALPEKELGECISMALTYHLRK